MSSSIAHDFNNSLQQMTGNLEIIKLQKDLSGNSADRLNSIETIIGDVSDRVSALQKFGGNKNDTTKNNTLNVNKLIEEVMAQSRPLWKNSVEKEGIRITVTTDFEESPKISCNSGELKSVIYNLIKNSVEAMPKGGNLAIKTYIKSKQVFITFTDTGIGMNDETKLKIFEPFYSTKGFELGRGLGMSGVYNVVTKHKGNIVVKHSELSKGTTIEMVFPLSEQDEIKIIKNEPKKINSLNVLWVDDDFIITTSSLVMVESLNHKCKTLNNGKSALEYLNNNVCDIVFTDIGMPEMNGFELASAIRSKFGKKIKIIAVTGWDIKDDHHFDFTLRKPFSLDQLKDALHL